MTIYFSDYPYKEWMKNLPDVLTKMPLNYIAIPGSHDSFTYSLTKNNDVSPDAEDILKKLVSIFGSLAKSVMSRWGKAQSLNPYSQLEAGVRYFDIRASRNDKAKGELYSCHGLFGNPLKDDLVLINDFLDSHPKEVVLLDFNHFYLFGVNEHNRLVRQIEQIFGSKLVTYSQFIPSLENLWKTKQRVFILYHCNAVIRPYLWPGYYIPSPWPNVNQLDPLKQFWDASYKAGHRLEYFYVFQGVLTPRTEDIVKHVFSSLKSRMADKASPAMESWLQDKTAGKNRINCSIIDFVGNYNYIASVMQVNMNTASELTSLASINMKGDSK